MNCRSQRNRRRRRELFERQGGICHYCRHEMTWSYHLVVPGEPFIPAPTDATLDHKTPLSRGGRETLENWVVACLKCNLIKGTLTAEEFEEFQIWLRANPTLIAELSSSGLTTTRDG